MSISTDEPSDLTSFEVSSSIADMAGGVKPGVKTSEYQALFLLFVSAIVMPILARHGIAADDVSNVAEISFGAAVAVYAAARTFLKVFLHR